MTLTDININITSISTACYVAPGTGRADHCMRPSHGLAYHLAGEKYYLFSDGRRIPISEGTVIYMPKYSSYQVHSASSGNCYAINFDIPDTETLEPFAVKIKNQSEVLSDFRKAEAAWRTKPPAYYEECGAMLYHIIRSIKKEMQMPYLPDSSLAQIAPAIEHIKQHYTEEAIEIPFLAALCGISEVYLRTLFQRAFGVSPVKYINSLKLDRAKELLRTGLYHVSEVAFLSGFSDASQFSRAFKQATGVSPRDFL